MSIPQLPRLDGRAPRVVSLVYNDASTDSRVLKTTATLRAAGADARIVASARDLAGHPAGTGQVGDLEVHRAPDLNLTRMLPGLTRAWRRFRGKDLREQATAPSAVPLPQAQTPPAATGRRESETAPTVPSGRDRLVARAADVWMRTYQTARLGYWWLGAVREGRSLEPDVVHANDANALVPAVLITLGTPGRVVYDSHELWRRRNIRQDRWLAPAVEALIESVGVRVAAGVITVSPSIAEWLQRTYSLTVRPTLVRNIPTARALPDPAGGRLRELAGLAAQDKVVSYVGGITTGRGLEETVDAMALLPPDTHLVLLGYGDERYIAGLLERARGAGVSDRVHLAGSVPSPQVPQTLADADVAVVYVRPICLSYRYSLPNKLFESIHAGLPIVAADLPDTSAIVRHYGVGEVFDATTPAELAAAIEQVLADPTTYRAAAREAAAELTWEHEAADLVGLYTRVLEGRRG
ncbi:glycosyltransferase [Ornithinimicrobium cavernae]|uniref:glycosyltransferase n=1 Tax=Ornithinimicrobium cavernae TaxID=2666047 RepID=UPI000D69A829|nr:glycosyltransferase [Ornithinimicrobium cavernae]